MKKNEGIKNRKCKTCLYRLYTNGSESTLLCGYLYYTGHMRGCDIEGCEKYIKSKAQERRRLTEKTKRELNESKLKYDEYDKYLGDRLKFNK